MLNDSNWTEYYLITEEIEEYKIKDKVMDIQVSNEIIIRIDSRFSNRNCSNKDYDSMVSIQ